MQMCVEVNISKKHLLFLSRSVTIKDKLVDVVAGLMARGKSGQHRIR